MTTADRRRRLVRHGVLLFFLSLARDSSSTACGTRAWGVAAHTGGLVSGLFIAVVGLRLVRAPVSPTERTSRRTG